MSYRRCGAVALQLRRVSPPTRRPLPHQAEIPGFGAAWRPVYIQYTFIYFDTVFWRDQVAVLISISVRMRCGRRSPFRADRGRNRHPAFCGAPRHDGHRAIRGQEGRGNNRDSPRASTAKRSPTGGEDEHSSKTRSTSTKVPKGAKRREGSHRKLAEDVVARLNRHPKSLAFTARPPSRGCRPLCSWVVSLATPGNPIIDDENESVSLYLNNVLREATRRRLLPVQMQSQFFLALCYNTISGVGSPRPCASDQGYSLPH